MLIDKKTIIQRINHLIFLATKSYNNSRGVTEVCSGTINILEILYSPESLKCKAYVDEYNVYIRDSQKSRHINLSDMARSSLGTLESIKDEIKAGLIGNLELQAQGDVFGDFIKLAKESLNESKDVAAVLVSAALEDALKKFALQKGLDVDDANMEQVINALMSEGLMKGAQASLAKNHKQLRKYAFHANWDKFDKTIVSSAIGFTESFILDKFS